MAGDILFLVAGKLHERFEGKKSGNKTGCPRKE
jgi:hypothetical protein